LIGKPRPPITVKHGSRELFSHERDYVSRCYKSRTWKSLPHCVYAKEVVAVAMCGVDCSHVLSTRGDPLSQLPVLINRDEGIDENSISLT
jgi:hypothetical protein